MADDEETPSSGLTDRWNRFWYSPGNTLSLGIFRALFAICLAIELADTRDRSLFAIAGGFHLPYFPFIGLVSPQWYDRIHDLQIPFIALLGLGVLPRIAAAMLLGLQGYVFFSDQLNFRNHPYFFLLVLALLALSPAGESFSVPAVLRRSPKDGERAAPTFGTIAPLTVQRLIQLQISIVYFYSALHKMSERFLGGHVLMRTIAPKILDPRTGLGSVLPVGALRSIAPWVVQPEFWILAACGTVLLELSLPFALWIPRARRWAMLLGIPFHLSIAFFMGIQTFSGAMIASYLLFLDPGTVPRLAQQARERLLGRPRQPARKAKRT